MTQAPPAHAGSGTGSGAGSGTDRLHHVDALRAFCMLYGVLLHATTVVDGPVFSAIADASGFFRMTTFFVIAGYFSHLVLVRGTVGDFLVRRSVLLLVPFATVLVLLNPLTFWLSQVYFEGGSAFSLGAFLTQTTGRSGLIVWHIHLWFLVALWVYTLATPALVPLLGRLDGVVARAATAPAVVFVGGAAILAGAAWVGALVVNKLLSDHVIGTAPGVYIVTATVKFAPFYLLGLVLWRVRPAFLRLGEGSLVVLSLGILLCLGAAWAQDRLPGPLASVAEEFAHGVTNLAMVAILLRVFGTIAARQSRAVRFVVDAAFSVYLFHYLVITVLALALRPWIALDGALYGLIVVLTYAITLGLHHFVVGRTALTRLLFNGKLEMPRRSPARA